MNLPDILDPRKESGKTLYLGLIVILVALCAFAAGRLSAAGNGASQPQGLTVRYSDVAGAAGQGISAAALASQNLHEPALGEAVAAPDLSLGSSRGNIVASKSGTKYHLLTCPGAKSIKEENRIYFDGRQEAEAAGYSAAANCKGLQ